MYPILGIFEEMYMYSYDSGQNQPQCSFCQCKKIASTTFYGKYV